MRVIRASLPAIILASPPMHRCIVCRTARVVRAISLDSIVSGGNIALLYHETVCTANHTAEDAAQKPVEDRPGRGPAGATPRIRGADGPRHAAGDAVPCTGQESRAGIQPGRGHLIPRFRGCATSSLPVVIHAKAGIHIPPSLQTRPEESPLPYFPTPHPLPRRLFGATMPP